MSFSDYFPAETAGIRIFRRSPEALAQLPYPDEIELKNQVFANFLRYNGFAVPSPLVPSPLSRRYRSTGKRRITYRKGQIFLHLGRVPGTEVVADSLLEPEENMTVYHLIRQKLSLPHARAAAETANYCIIRGTGRDRTLILNVRRLSGEIVRTLRNIAEEVRREVPSLQSAFLYVDETGSDYYFETERPEGKLGWKKIFGPEELSLRIEAPEKKKFLYPPAVFSQINESILPVFAERLMKVLKPEKNDQLLDLYCGYGLWSLLLAPYVRSVWGAELSREAIHAAKGNAAYHYPNKNMRYVTGNIDADSLRENAPQSRFSQELILLDPPRNGTSSGIQEYLISRRPRKIAHVFCSVDEMPGALKIYQANGCKVEKIIPFDFFPGTMNLEILAVIRPPEAAK